MSSSSTSSPNPTSPQTIISEAREQFIGMVGELRPELHRYCARLTGSVIEGEDIVQDTLAKAFYALSLSAEMPPLRPWLFRIAHNTAIDFLRSHGRKHTELTAEMDEIAVVDDLGNPDPLIVRAALTRFLELSLVQRSAVILKDVLGHSLEETAETMGTTVMAVKAALVRGRANLRVVEDEPKAIDPSVRKDLDRYTSLFNARDWDGVRGLVGDDCRLDLVSRSQRRGKQVGMYFSRYEKENITLKVVRLEGRLALAAYVAADDRDANATTSPSYFILLDWESGRVASIRDFRYVSYIAKEAVFELV